MTEPDYCDRKTLQAWLETQPRDFAMAIVARAALRTLPLLYFEVDRSHRHAAAIRSARIFPAFHAFAVPFVAAAYGPFGEEYRDSVADAGEQVSNACGAIPGTSENAGPTTGCDETYGILASVCYRAVGLSVTNSYSETKPEFFAGAANAALLAAHTPITTGDRLQEVGGNLHGALDALNRDINLVTSNKVTGAELAIAPLWHGEAADWAARSWNLLKENLMDADEGWDVWTRWYEARLSGGLTYTKQSTSLNRSIELSRIAAGYPLHSKGALSKNGMLNTVEKKWVKYDLRSDWDFFLSYSEFDEDYARLFVDIIEGQGRTVFAMYKDIKLGNVVPERMNYGLENSNRVIALISEDYLNSSNCMTEWQVGYSMDPSGRERNLLQFLVQEVEGKLPPIAKNILYSKLYLLPRVEQRNFIEKVILDFFE